MSPRRLRRLGRLAEDEEGSILPLAIGYAVLTIAVVFVCACATSLYLAQQRLDQVADAAALAGADGFVLALEAGQPRATLTDAAVREQAAALLAGRDVELVAAASPDGRSARVTVRAVWHPPLISAFVPAAVSLAATATSRTTLR